MTAGLITCDTLAVFDQNGSQDQMPVELPVEIPIDTQIVERHNVLLDTQNIIDATCRLDGLATNSDIRMSFYAEGGYHYVCSQFNPSLLSLKRHPSDFRDQNRQ